MNHSNIIVIISTLMLAIIFLVAVFFNLEIKESKKELNLLQNDIEEIRMEIKRKEIEITTLISPLNIVEYIEKNKLKPIPIKNIEVLLLKKD